MQTKDIQLDAETLLKPWNQRRWRKKTRNFFRLNFRGPKSPIAQRHLTVNNCLRWLIFKHWVDSRLHNGSLFFSFHSIRFELIIFNELWHIGLLFISLFGFLIYLLGYCPFNAFHSVGSIFTVDYRWWYSKKRILANCLVQRLAKIVSIGSKWINKKKKKG